VIRINMGAKIQPDNTAIFGRIVRSRLIVSEEVGYLNY